MPFKLEEQATAVANAAAASAGVDVRELADPEATGLADALFAAIWHTPTAVGSDLMLALAKAGNYVAGAYTGDQLVGASIAFFTGDTPRALHSHIAGVSPHMQGRSVGFALKLHQRAWALRRGICRVEWTVDPLVRRNVFFNLAKLGADATDYVPNFYGEMTDGVNAQDESDRLVISWPLASARVVTASEGTPVLADSSGSTPVLHPGHDGWPVRREPTGDVLCCAIPADITRIRATDRPLASAWRHALRDTLTDARRDGYRVAGVSREGDYVLVRDTSSVSPRTISPRRG